MHCFTQLLTNFSRHWRLLKKVCRLNTVIASSNHSQDTFKIYRRLSNQFYLLTYFLKNVAILRCFFHHSHYQSRKLVTKLVFQIKCILFDPLSWYIFSIYHLQSDQTQRINECWRMYVFPSTYVFTCRFLRRKILLSSLIMQNLQISILLTIHEQINSHAISFNIIRSYDSYFVRCEHSTRKSLFCEHHQSRTYLLNHFYYLNSLIRLKFSKIDVRIQIGRTVFICDDVFDFLRPIHRLHVNCLHLYDRWV